MYYYLKKQLYRVEKQHNNCVKDSGTRMVYLTSQHRVESGSHHITYENRNIRNIFNSIETYTGQEGRPLQFFFLRGVQYQI